MNTFALFFEVMDKEPSVADNYVFFVSLGVGAFLLCRYRVWLAFIVLPVLLLCAVFQWVELHDPFVGPAILREAGRGYFVHCYVAMGLAGFLSLVGVLAGLKMAGVGAWLRRAT